MGNDEGKFMGVLEWNKFFLPFRNQKLKINESD